MPRPCSICLHDKEKEINRALLKGATLVSISQLYSVSQFSLHRHRKNHLIGSLSREPKVKGLKITDNAVETLKSMLAKLKDIEKKAEKAKNLNIAILAIREIARLTELVEKIAGRLKDSEINIYMNPEFVHIQTLIASALEPFPEAKMAVVEALSNVARYGE